jgi:precorrin-6B methylase 2
MVSNDINKWIEHQGINFLKDIGMKKDQFIVDFGCSHGTYTIPASLVVGEKGRVYAVDKNQESLNKLI